MDKDIRMALDSFGDVWSRVEKQHKAKPNVKKHVRGPGSAPRPESKGDTQAKHISKFLEAEARQVSFYTSLAKRCQGRFRAVLMRIASDEKRHFTLLHTEYFLLTGECRTLSAPTPVINGVLSALRQAYEHENAASESYARAAAEADNDRLRSLYSTLSAEEAGHAREIRRLIEASMK